MNNINKPKWYDNAFDNYISVGEELDNIDDIKRLGFQIPKNNKSRSSIIHDSAVINNSFNENNIRKTLDDIYNNSYYKLMANNNDNVHFYKWEGYMSHMTLIPNSTKCEFRLPWDLFIYSGERDKFKLSQFYNKWIKVEDILNNWNIFKWHILVFINQKVYSEYEIYIQEQEVIIRFDYNSVWSNNNYPVYIYKFDTNFQKRVLISKELLYNQWSWQIPYSHIGDLKIKNNQRVILSINKISDPSIRTDGNTRVDVLGDNLEFLSLDPNSSSLDFSKISQNNVEYINSEKSQYLWLSIFVPKFMQEYPKFLVTDIIFRPYLPRLRPIDILQQSIPKRVKGEIDEASSIKEENVRQIYIDENPSTQKNYDGWMNIIRPIVLSDAYTNHIEPYDVIRDEIDTFKSTIGIFSNTVSNFKHYIKNDNLKNAENWNQWIELLKNHGENLYNTQGIFLDKRLSPRDKVTEDAWDVFIKEIEMIRAAGWNEIYIPYDFYPTCNTIIQKCVSLTEKFYIANIIRSITRKYLWCDPDEYKGKVRFQRPVDVNNFWCFEYDTVDQVWRPKAREIIQHFPDVYFVKPLSNETINPNGVYKAFFFYSDTINPRELSNDIMPLTPSYDDVLYRYEEMRGAYHNVFMERFYWMALNSIYKGLLLTGSKWEMMEYVADNPSYVRFNELFTNTMEPYYKLGLETYLKSDDFGFPFDDVVNKMKEIIKLKWNGYDKISNFEIYLYNQWIPSYFDYMTKILDDSDMTNRIVKRPPLTFNILTLENSLKNTFDNNLPTDIVNILDQCKYDQEIYSVVLLNKIKIILQNYETSDTILQDKINACISYIDLANTAYIPCNEWPTYMNMYSINDLSIQSSGVSYNNNDIINIPDVGTFEVNETLPNGTVTSLIPHINYYQLSFNDPSRLESYMSRDNGDVGMGLTVNVNSVTDIPIVANRIIIPTVSFIYEILNALVISANNPNPIENFALSKVISKINDIQERWNYILAKYSSNITSNLIESINLAIDKLPDVQTAGDQLIESRSKLDIRLLLKKYNHLIETIKHYRHLLGWSDPQFIDKMAEEVRDNIQIACNSGEAWDSESTLRLITQYVSSVLNKYSLMLSAYSNSEAKIICVNLINELKNIIIEINTGIDEINISNVTINTLDVELKSILDPLDHTNINDNLYYRIYEASIASPGNNYSVGQIVSIAIPDKYVLMKGYSLCFEIISIDAEGVASVKPMIEYALSEKIWGVFETFTNEISGDGLKIDIKTESITPELLIDPDNYFVDAPNKFDDSELMTFKFDNIHDLELNYEVFIGGKQVTDFYQRHEDNSHLNSRKLDVLYINANKINNLKNSSLYISGDQHFIYKINSITIQDPGAGYHNGQEIYVDADEYCLKLLVSKLIMDPYKGIAEISLTDGKLIYERYDIAGENLNAVDDQQNNIDDEFHVSNYDKLTADGVSKPISPKWPDITFIEHRHDNLPMDDRNDTFMYPSIPMLDPLPDPACDDGDPEHHFYQGNRIDNSITGDINDKWNGIQNVEEVTHPFIDDTKRIPPNQPVKGEYQFISQVLMCNSENSVVTDYNFETFAERPVNKSQLPNVIIGKTVGINVDETRDLHRCIYKITGINGLGELIYDDGIISDETWRWFDVFWMDSDYKPGYPNIRQQYPDAPWMTVRSYDMIKRNINTRKWKPTYVPHYENNSTYIHNIGPNDISVFNWTTKEWEDLNDQSRWELESIFDDDDNDLGFTLTFLKDDEYFKYDMKLYLNKTADTQKRNNSLLRNAKLDIFTSIIDEINILPARVNINTGRSIRIRKLFPYTQTKNYTISEHTKEDGMLFKLADYMHYRNEIHLEDIILFNNNTNSFENVMDSSRFDVWFRNISYKEKNTEVILDENTAVIDDVGNTINIDDVQVINQDSTAIPIVGSDEIRIVADPIDVIYEGTETYTKITSHIVTYPGDGYTTGSAWAYNKDHNIQIFGDIKSDMSSHVLSFTPRHIPEIPDAGNYEFIIYQSEYIGTHTAAKMYVEFRTFEIESIDDGWIKNITDAMAVPPKGEFKIIPKYNIPEPTNYTITIDKTPHRWRFMGNDWEMTPTYKIPNYQAPQDRFYMLLNNIRMPIVNCSTEKPTLDTNLTETGTDVTFLNLYRRNEQVEIRTLPYPVRSVYVQRNIPKHGYINLEGKINKPLNKTYFEFWVNGKLLDDEVTIISPTKIFLHGLTSLKNLEILEINRSQDEYFSDEFLEVIDSEDSLRPYPVWNYSTYLDDALKGTLPDDNYAIDEQEKLLTPVWRQVGRDHPDYKDYPENVDTDRDILLRLYTSEDLPLPDIVNTPFQYMVLNAPTLEGIPLTGRSMVWSQFKWKPIDYITIVNLLNDEWKEEINNDPYLQSHVIIDKNEWYGMSVRLYDEYGILTHNLNEALYKVYDPNIISINSTKNTINIIKNEININLD
jgi:hypothetical protein